MEQWQKHFVTSNGAQLREYTTCNTHLLAELLKSKVLGVPDITQLDAVRNSVEGHQAQVRLLYDISQTRNGAYAAIIHALHETNQYGARDLLMCGYVEEGTIPPPFEFAYEIFNWNSKHFSLRNRILSKYAYVQGQKILLSQVCQHIDANVLNALMERTITKNDAVKMLNDKSNFTLVSNTIPSELEYYVYRTLIRRSRLSLNVLKLTTTDIFVVKGITLHQFANLAFPNIVDRSGNQLERLSVRHILCELDQDFEAICKNSPPGISLHFLIYENDGLHWLKTHGRINAVQRCIHENQNKIHEELFVNNMLEDYSSCQPVCISDTAGMGKTILLANIAHKLNLENDNTLVLFFVLREFVQSLPSKSKDVTGDKIRELISAQVTTCAFGQEVVKQLLTCPKQKFELCFDGFDEILVKQTDSCKKLFELIQSEFRNIRLHVSTRPHMLQQLEDTLCVLGHNILPFDLNDQIDFLVRYWKCKEDIPSNKCDVIVDFATRCLEAMKCNMADFELDVGGVPLQCRLLGEVYQTQIKRIIIERANIDLPIVNSIHKMYCILMMLRFERAEVPQRLKEKSRFKTGKAFLTKRKRWAEKLKKVHYLFAVDLLFPEFIDLFKVILPIDLSLKYLSRREIFEIGVLEPTFKKNYRFTHRTFAEFLLAELLIDIIKPENYVKYGQEFRTQFMDFLFCRVLFTHTQLHSVLRTNTKGTMSQMQLSGFDHSTVTYFMNGHLNENSLTSCDFVDICQHLLAIKRPDYSFYKIFVACALSNLSNLFRLLVELYKTLKQDEFSLPPIVCIAAAKYAGSEFNLSLRNFKNQNRHLLYTNQLDDESFMKKPFQLNAESDQSPTVQVLINKRGFTRSNKSLLHACLVGSQFDNFTAPWNQLEIINLTLDEHTSLKDEKQSKENSTQILEPSSYNQLIRCMLDNGADVNAVSFEQKNLLHILLKNDGDLKLENEDLMNLFTLKNKFKFGDYTNEFWSRLSIDLNHTGDPS